MTAQDVRDAAHAGEYGRAEELFREYARTLTVNEASLRDMAELIEWVRASVLCARAHGAARLQDLRAELHALSAYSHEISRPR